jgi:hypothetical protein
MDTQNGPHVGFPWVSFALPQLLFLNWYPRRARYRAPLFLLQPRILREVTIVREMLVHAA